MWEAFCPERVTSFFSRVSTTVHVRFRQKARPDPNLLVHLREALSTNADVAKRLAELEMKTESLELSHDTFSRNTRLQLRQLLDAVRELTTPPDPPKRPIGFITPDDKKDAPKGATAGRGRKT
jgi:hypothetical protein